MLGAVAGAASVALGRTDAAATQAPMLRVASDAASYVSGNLLPVDGASTAA
jgi:hypothetical protein